jgi:hypothetical protein
MNQISAKQNPEAYAFCGKGARLKSVAAGGFGAERYD